MRVVGHRGGIEDAPENTIAALQKSIAHGIYHFEVDIRLSSDLELVVIHDNNLLRVAGIDANVDELSSEELSHVTMHSRNGHSATGVPTLTTLLQQCTPLRSIQLELKSDERTDRDTLIEQLIRWLDRTEITHCPEIVITSFDTELISAIKKLSPRLKTGIVTQHPIDSALEQCLQLDCSYLCFDHRSVEQWTPELWRSLEASKLHLSAWTVNEVSRFKLLRELPIHSIISDCPKAFMKAAAEQSN